MTKLVIPTRNRPTSLGALFDYLARFYPGAEVVIANGSTADYLSSYRSVVEKHSAQLSVAYHEYDAAISLADRLCDVLSRLKDDVVIVGADDDYPILDVLEKAAEFLASHADYVVATGGVVFLRLEPQDELHAALLHARSVEQPTPIRRMNHYSEWPFATSYGAVRRKHFMERCDRADLNGIPGFGDYTVAFHDCLAGKIKALDELCYLRTMVHTHSKLGRRGTLFYLERASDILDTYQHYREVLVRELSMTEEEAEKTAARLVNVRISAHINPAPQNRRGFGRSKFFADPVVRRQYADFEGLFTDGSDARERLFPLLHTVVDGMRTVAASGIDNAGEPKVYDTLEEMRIAMTPTSTRV